MFSIIIQHCISSIHLEKIYRNTYKNYQIPFIQEFFPQTSKSIKH